MKGAFLAEVGMGRLEKDTLLLLLKDVNQIANYRDPASSILALLSYTVPFDDCASLGCSISGCNPFPPNLAYLAFLLYFL